uniref:hypothetical protein n=1 Tax=Salmonella sp. ZJHZ21_0176 TaxID=3159601 RepID=UPI0039816DFB
PASERRAAEGKTADDGDDWIAHINQSVAENDDHGWGWEGSASDNMTTAVSALEVDPLTEYQVYKQFGYEYKAAASLAGYLN